MNCYRKKYHFFCKNGDVGEKISGNNADSQEQIRELTSNDNMIDYCQFIYYAKFDGML